MTECNQRLVPTDEISGPTQAQLSEGCRCQTRAITLIADEDHALVTIKVEDPGLTRRRQPPLQHVPFDYQGTGQRPVALTLFQGSDVDDKGSGRDFVAQIRDVHSFYA